MQERTVAKLGETLARYKREIGNCLTAASEKREQEGRYADEADAYEEAAEKLMKKAMIALAEAER